MLLLGLRELPEYGICGNYPCIASLEGVQGGVMYIFGRNNMFLELEGPGSTCIGCKQTGKSKVMCGSYCSLHAHMGLHPADYQLFNRILLNYFKQAGPGKSIDLVL